MKRKDAQEIVRAMAACWNARDLDGYLEHLHEDVVWNDPAMPMPAVGKREVRAFSESVLRAFPDFHYEIRSPICLAEDGTRCAVPWRIRATHADSFDPPGYAATMRTAEFEGVDLIRFEGSRVLRIETLFDILIPAEQLLGIRLRPRPDSLRGRLLVGGQRVWAWALRLARRAGSGTAGR